MSRSPEGVSRSWGATRTEPIRYRCPCGLLFSASAVRTLNATRDPGLADRLRAGTLARVVCPDCGVVGDAPAPVVFHDEAAGKVVLVLPPSFRHRELEERAAYFLALARDDAPALPPYATELQVIYGGESLPATPVLDVVMPASASTDGAVGVVIEDSTNRMALGQERARLPPADKSEAALRWELSRAASAFEVAGSDVRLLLKLGDRIPSGTIDVRVQLHRLPSYPLITITVGTDGEDEPSAVFFDVERSEDREALALLSRSFRLVLDFYDDEYDPVTRREVELPLAGNVRHALAVADEHLAGLSEPHRSFDAAVASWRSAAFDRFGRRDPRLDEDSFAHLPSPAAVQQALAVVSGWSEPSNEDYLLLVRSFPVDWWKRIRGRVVARAVELGLVLPGALLEVALAESAVGSRRELVTGLLHAFALLCAEPEANDLDADQTAANWRALFILAEEEGALVDAHVAEVARKTPGVRPPLATVPPRRLALGTEDEMLAVRPRETRPDLSTSAVAELLDLLDDKDLRLGAALELVKRADPVAVGPVFAAIRRMTRGEAVRVLPVVIQFGDQAVPHLVDGLRSRKAYLRQGSALALGVLRSGDGLDALCDLLVTEPTEIWKEIARAIGDVGGTAVVPLLRRLREPETQDPEVGDRIAWALAHIAAKSGRPAIEGLASGRDAVAAVAASRALDLAAEARENDAQVRGRLSGEVTVNRAFSKKFFEGMTGPPRAEPATLDSGLVVADPSGESRPVLEADGEVLEEEDILPG